MLKKITILTTIMAVLAMFSSFVFADEAAKTEKAKHEFIGEQKCKMCHTKDGTHASWLETKHAKAWDLLSDKEKEDKECVKCHSTGTLADGTLLKGVQCEACHGAGNDYKKKSVMEDKAAAIAAGLIIPDEKLCKTCHENVPEKFRSKEKFDFEKMKAKGVHKMKAAAEEKKG